MTRIHSIVEYSLEYKLEKKVETKLYKMCCIVYNYLENRQKIIDDKLFRNEYSNKSLKEKKYIDFDDFPLCPPLLLRETKINDDGESEALCNLQVEFIKNIKTFSFDSESIFFIVDKMNDKLSIEQNGPWDIPLFIKINDTDFQLKTIKNEVFFEIPFETDKLKQIIIGNLYRENMQEKIVYFDLSKIFDFKIE